jgi:hypothetical protein
MVCHAARLSWLIDRAERVETASDGGNAPNEPNGLMMQTDLELEDMAMSDVDSPKKRSQCPRPRGWEDLF